MKRLGLRILTLMALVGCGESATGVEADCENGCGNPVPPIKELSVDLTASNWVDELTVEQGCADVILYRTNSEQSISLTLYAPGLYALARESETPIAESYSFPGDDAKLTLTVGTEVLVCTDIEGGNSEVHLETYAATGTADVLVQPLEPSPGTPERTAATAVLRGVTFTLKDAEGKPVIVTLPETSITADVGWFPG